MIYLTKFPRVEKGASRGTRLSLRSMLRHGVRLLGTAVYAQSRHAGSMVPGAGAIEGNRLEQGGSLTPDQSNENWGVKP